MVTTVDVLFGTMTAAGVLLCILGYVSHRQWDEPGSTMFGVFVAGWGSLPLIEPVLNVVFGVGGVTGILWGLTVVPWCLFSLQYTGRSFGLRTVAFLLIPTLGLLPWLWSETVGTGTPAFEALGVLLFVYYTALAIIGAVVILRAAQRYGHLSLTQGLWLALAGVIPAVTMNTFGVLLEQFAEPVLFGVYATGLVGSCVVVALALFQDDVFDSTPAAGTVGEKAVLRETDDLLLITDDDAEVILGNETVAETLPVTETEALGKPVESVIAVGIDDLQSKETVELQTRDGVQQFDPQVTTLTDQHGRQIGSMVSLRDVTDREIRRQRLEVLNRIVRHNLRNQASVIKANTEAAADEIDDEQLLSYLDTASNSVDSLTSLGQKAKTIEDLLGRDTETVEPIDLQEFLDGIVAESTEQWPEATVTVREVPAVTIESDRRLLQLILSNLVENAVEHADSESPTVELCAVLNASDERYPVTIEVADDGPGIPDREIEVIETGTETPLKHGSGVGLWVTNWAVRELGGELSFPECGLQGSTIHVRLPHHPMQSQ